MVKLHDDVRDKVVEEIAMMLREDLVSAASFDADEVDIIWMDSGETFLLLDFTNNTFKTATPSKLEELMFYISDEALVEFAENYDLIEIDEDGNAVFLNDDEEN